MRSLGLREVHSLAPGHVASKKLKCGARFVRLFKFCSLDCEIQIHLSHLKKGGVGLSIHMEGLLEAKAALGTAAPFIISPPSAHPLLASALLSACCQSASCLLIVSAAS